MDESSLDNRDLKENWSKLRTVFQDRISQKTLTEWILIFDTLDACVTPVLEISELKTFPHHVFRKTGTIAAPRFQNQIFSGSDEPLIPGQNSIDIVKELGLEDYEISSLIKNKILIQSKL